MAGLIQQQMGNAPAPNPGMAEGQMPMGEMAEGEGPDPETDPGYNQAMEFAMEAMYGQGAAKDMATSLKAPGNPSDIMANTAYEIVSIVDERTEGAIPDELLVLFASRILEEVAEIAEAAGVQYQPSDVALALKQMILRFLGEQGVDTTQLQQAMDEVNSDDFNQAAMEGEMTEEEVPV